MSRKKAQIKRNSDYALRKNGAAFEEASFKQNKRRLNAR